MDTFAYFCQAHIIRITSGKVTLRRRMTRAGCAAAAGAAALGWLHSSLPANRALTCASLSKAYGAPGLRIGWLTVSDPRLREQLRLAKFNSSVCCGALVRRFFDRLAERRTVVASWAPPGHAASVPWRRAPSARWRPGRPPGPRRR